MTIRISLKSLRCPDEGFAKKMLYECRACSRYVSYDKKAGTLLCGDKGSNDCMGRGGPGIPQAKWEIAQSYEKKVCK